MKLVLLCAAIVGGLLVGHNPLAAQAPASAAELAAKLSELQQDGNTFIRAKMIVSTPANPSGPKTILQLQIKSRRVGGKTDVVYQVLFPKERKGEAALVKSDGTGAALTPPDKVQTFDASGLKNSLFGGDLSYEDVSDNFFAWKDQTLVGTEAVGNVTCQILESKPKGARSSYAMVKSWIDTKRMVPLRVEKYGAGNQLVRRIDTQDVVNVDGRNVLAMLVIRRPGEPTATEMDGSRIKRGVIYTDADFTVEGLKNLAGPKGGE